MIFIQSVRNILTNKLPLIKVVYFTILHILLYTPVKINIYDSLEDHLGYVKKGRSHLSYIF